MPWLEQTLETWLNCLEVSRYRIRNSTLKLRMQEQALTANLIFST